MRASFCGTSTTRSSPHAEWAERSSATHSSRRPDDRWNAWRRSPGAPSQTSSKRHSRCTAPSRLTASSPGSPRRKLAAFGLDAHLDFEVGAYGSDDPVRSNLVDIARQRAAKKYQVALDETTTVLIGDTPSDVATARQGGAAVIAVASGRSDTAALRAAGAEIILEDLTNTAALVKAATGDGS